MNTLTSLAPRIPTVIRVNGHKLTGMKPDAPHVPVDGFPGVTYVVEPHDAVVLSAWRSTDHGTTHVRLTNRLPIGTPPLRIQTNADGKGNTYLLDPLCALQWTDAGWLLRQSDPDAPERPDLRALVQADATSKRRTMETGSSDMEFYHRLDEVIVPDAVGYDVALFLDAYARRAARRPRNLINEIGDFGTDPHRAYGLWWNIDKNWWRSGVNPQWAENSYGLNMGDEQHPDLYELVLAHRFLRHPLYLIDAINFWRWLDRYSYYLQRTTDKPQWYGGSARTPGWHLRNADLLLACLEDLHGPWWDAARTEIEASVDYHVTNARWWLDNDWPLKGQYGSVSADPAWHVGRDPKGPPIKHSKPYMTAVWAFGLAPHSVDGREVATRMMEWVQDQCFNPTARTVASNWGVQEDGAVVREWGPLTSTALWHLPALIESGMENTTMAQQLFDAVKGKSYALNFAAPLLGAAVTP